MKKSSIARSTNSPKYNVIAQILERRIQSGHWQVGDMLPAQRDLMDEFSVSLVTIRRALDILTEKDMVQRIPGKGTFVIEPKKGHLANPHVDATLYHAALPSQSELEGMVIGAVFKPWTVDDHFHNSCCQRILRGAEYAANLGGGHIRMFQPSNEGVTSETIKAWVRSLVAEGVNSVLWMPDDVDSKLVLALHDCLQDQGIPMVTVTSTIFSDSGSSFNLVSVNAAQGLESLLDELKDVGHQTFAYLLTQDTAHDPARHAAFTSALDAECQEVLMLPEHPEDDQALAKQIVVLVKKGMTAFLCDRDSTAAWLATFLRGNGISVPDDVTVCGYGDSFQFRHHELTTIGLPLKELGVLAIDVLKRAMYDGHLYNIANLRVAPSILHRRTSGPARVG